MTKPPAAMAHQPHVQFEDLRSPTRRLLAPTVMFDPDPPTLPAGDPPADPPADAETPPASPPAAPDTDVLTDIAAMAAELGITPGQLKGRLDASKKWEQRAKKADEDLEAARLAGLDDQARAIEEAKNAGKAEAVAGFAETLAAAKIEAALTGIVPEAEIAGVIADLKVSNYITDGQPDPDKIASLKTRYAGFVKQPGPGSADAGPQGLPPGTPTLDEQIAAATKAGDPRLAISLKNQKLAALGPE